MARPRRRLAKPGGSIYGQRCHEEAGTVAAEGLRALTSDLCVVFGGTGDLSLRMLSFYYLEAEHELPPTLRIVAVGREALDRDGFIEQARRALELRIAPERFDPEVWSRLASKLDYVAADTEGVELRPLPLSLSLASAFGTDGGRRAHGTTLE